MERSRNVEDLHHLRLMALLHELVRERDLRGAAEALGLDPRTVSASMDRGALSGLVQVALERWLLAEGDREAARCRDELRELTGSYGGLEQRVDGLAEDVGRAVEEVRGIAEAGNQGGDVAQDLRRLERRVSRLESAGGSGAGPAAGASGGSAGRSSATAVSERRRYPDLVTVDGAPDDEEVFGDAWPLVKEWRELWWGHSDLGRGLRWLTAEVRILDLELALLEDHGLTLPPETEPLWGLARNAQLGWRRRALAHTRRKLARRRSLRWLRRGITLGLWWR